MRRPADGTRGIAPAFCADHPDACALGDCGSGRFFTTSGPVSAEESGSSVGVLGLRSCWRRKAAAEILPPEEAKDVPEPVTAEERL